MTSGYLSTIQQSINYEWNLQDFPRFVRNIDLTIKSPELRADFTPGTLWYVKLYFHNDSSDKKEWISVSLKSQSENPEKLKQWSIFILNNKKEMVLIKQFDITPTNNPFVNSYQNLIEKKKILNNRDEFLFHDTLTIGIKLVVQFDVSPSDIKFLPNLTKRCIGDDLKELLKNMTECDVTLIVKNEEFQAHKIILMTRSPVFTAMFSHEMKEKKDNTVTIPNVDPVIFKRILEFIYTDKVENLEVYAERLLEVADQYQLSYLKELCEESIEKSLTIGNVFKIMTLADHANSEQLLDRCMYVAAADINSIIITKGYKEAISSPQSTRILSKLVEKLAFIIADNKSDDLTTNVITTKKRRPSLASSVMINNNYNYC